MGNKNSDVKNVEGRLYALMGNIKLDVKNVEGRAYANMGNEKHIVKNAIFHKIHRTGAILVNMLKILRASSSTHTASNATASNSPMLTFHENLC
jgi:hypothetical protein